MSLTAYKAAAQVVSTSDDAAIQSHLDRATALIEGYIGYPLKRQVYSERVPGYGSYELQVSRLPLRAIESVSYGEDLFEPTGYDISNESAGLIYRELGWPWTAGVEYDLTAHIVPRSELKSFTVVYEAGFCVNGSTASGWLTTGESVPGDIESALVMATSFLYKSAGRDLSIASKSIGDLSISYQGGRAAGFGGGGSPSIGLPDTVKGLLSQWRRF